ncbi:MAG: flavodoxin [Oscillospiraceae bacterium]|nr:flavodoxin [Oscillospiraceae bacterium]
MNTAIVYYSQHHSNTKKLLDAIKAADPTVELINVTSPSTTDLSAYDRIGFASGIYYASFSKQVLSFADSYLPEGKDVFFIYTHGAPKGGFLTAIQSVTEKKHCRELGAYHCLGFDTFGPFKLVGGIAKGHPTEDEIKGAVKLYKEL